MNEMRTHFDIYDVLIYILPGAVFSFILYHFIVNIFGIGIDISYSHINSFIGGVSLLIVSFLAGHILYIIGNFIEKLPPHNNTKFSHKLLESNNDRITTNTKNEIKKLARTKFGLVINENERESNKIDELFKFCQQYILQKETAPKTEIFNRLYSLYRSLFTLSVSGITYYVFLAVKRQLEYSDIVFLIFCFITYLLFKSRWERFNEIFAHSVYLNFYVLCNSECGNTSFENSVNPEQIQQSEVDLSSRADEEGSA